MANTKKTLSTFRVVKAGQGYSLHIEDDAGEVIEFEATADQLDIIAETLEDLLEADDSDDEEEDEE